MLFDEVNIDAHFSDLRQFLLTDGTIESKKTLVALLYNHDLLEDALTLLQTVPRNTSENSLFGEYYELMIELKQLGGNGIYQMTVDQADKMRSLANGNSSIAVSAQGILTLVYDEVFDNHNPQGSFSQNDDSISSENNPNGLGQTDFSLNVYPNPSSKSISASLNISYSIIPNFSSATIRIMNQYGEVTSTNSILSQTGEIILPTTNMPLGINVIQLIVENTIVAYKLVNLQQ